MKENETIKNGAAGGGQKVPAATILLIACVCGWFIMEMEILGVRVLSPYFGSAVYVVTGSVIGIFLLSLSAGYLLGGWLSNRPGSRRAMGLCIAGAGGWLCAMPYFVEPVCEGIFNLGLDEKWGSLLATLALFSIPTVLLSTVSPTVVRWMTQDPKQAGFNAGLVLAFSTAASFGGCILTAFYLVLFSLRATIFTSGAVLIALGAAILIWDTAAARRPINTGEL